MARIRERLTFANVVSVTALFVALGGGAYAVSIAEKNSVVSKSIKNGQVKTKDLAGNAVDGSKVGDDSLTGDDVAESTIEPVPSAASANHATNADSAANADHATNADSATNATNANHATSADSASHATSADSATTAGNGARVFDFDHPAGDPSPVSILTIGEMSLLAQCGLFPPTVMDLSVVSTTNADMSWGWLAEQNHLGATAFTDSLNLFPGGPESLVQISANAGAASTHRAEGQVVYHNANRVITLTFHAAARYDSGNAMNNRCQARGTALAVPG